MDMNPNYVHEPFEVIIREGLQGIQKLYRFPNNLGASVIRGNTTYGGEEGLWELGVLKFVNEGNEEYHLIYPKAICDDGDVIGWLTDEDIERRLDAISRLTEVDLIEENK